MKRLFLRLRLYLLDSEIAMAEDAQNRLHVELPKMHRQRARLLAKYFAAGGTTAKVMP